MNHPNLAHFLLLSLFLSLTEYLVPFDSSYSTSIVSDNRDDLMAVLLHVFPGANASERCEINFLPSSAVKELARRT